MEKLRICLVEDSLASAFIYEAQIHRQDPEMQVRICETLKEGIACCQTFTPHIVILDMNLPDSDGDITLQHIRRHDFGPACILAISGDPSIGPEAIAAGAKDFMLKVVGNTSRDLMERIHRLIPECCPECSQN